MKSTDRTLIEKAGYENGFENVKQSDGADPHGKPDAVCLFSSRHPVTVEIIEGKTEGAWLVRFSDNAILEELKRGLNKPLFGPQGIEAWDRQTLGVLLHRAAELALALPDTPVKNYEKRILAFLKEHPEDKGTEREQIARQRIGQDIYRDAMMQYWKGSCAVTGISTQELLRASHAKPWKDCPMDSDRLNVYNGFLLSANYDALFDSGLITFQETGTIVCSSELNKSDKAILGIERHHGLRWIDEKHFPFLRWHRDNVFRK